VEPNPRIEAAADAWWQSAIRLHHELRPTSHSLTIQEVREATRRAFVAGVVAADAFAPHYEQVEDVCISPKGFVHPRCHRPECAPVYVRVPADLEGKETK
jgi:hypothetical protein